MKVKPHKKTKQTTFLRSSPKVESFYCFICSFNGENCVEMSINANVENDSIKNQQVEDKLSKESVRNVNCKNNRKEILKDYGIENLITFSPKDNHSLRTGEQKIYESRI